MRTKCWSENLKEKCHLEDIGVDVRIISRYTFRKCGTRALNEFI
jgi:hypothetical protein